jgi:exodeoxyribonuclease VII small subunit
MTNSTKKTPTTSKTTKANYIELSQELNGVMTRLEQGELDVDEAVECYDRGLQIVSILETHLSDAENRVSELRAAAIPSSQPENEEE